MKVKCPGQDLRYWTADSVYLVPCRNCKKPVEFFRDDRSRKCPACGTRFKNPHWNPSCAEWCPHAKECVDFISTGSDPD